MNVLLFSPTFAPDRGGAESLAEDVGAHLAAAGHGVTVVTAASAAPAPPEQAEEWRGMRVWRVAVPPPHWPCLASPAVLAAERRLRRWYRELLARERVAAVALMRVDESCRHLLAVRRSRSFRLSLYVHGGELRHLQRRWPRVRLLLRRALRSADAIVAVSEDLGRETIAFAPETGGTVRVVPNGIDVVAVRAAPVAVRARPYVLFAGRLEPVKNPGLVVEAFARVAARVGVDLVFAGTGSLAASLAGQARVAGLADRVHFLGAVERSVTWSLMRGARCLVVPSRAEGHPLVVLEAWAAGLPVVASAVKGLRDLVPDGGGMVFPRDDPAALAALLVRFASDDDREAMALRSRIGAFDCGAFDLAARMPAHLEAMVGAGSS